MDEDGRRQGVRFEAVTAEGSAALEADAIRVILPNGFRFELRAEPGRGGSAVCHIESGRPEDESFLGFQLEPGAANLFSVNVSRWKKRSD